MAHVFASFAHTWRTWWRALRTFRVLGAHGRVFGGRGRVFGAHGRVLGAHGRILAVHIRVLGAHGRVLGSHGRAAPGAMQALPLRGFVSHCICSACPHFALLLPRSCFYNQQFFLRMSLLSSSLAGVGAVLSIRRWVSLRRSCVPAKPSNPTSTIPSSSPSKNGLANGIFYLFEWKH